MKYLFCAALFVCSFLSRGQDTERVLFIGNSYTYYNDLPDMLVQAANSVGDVVIQDDNAFANASLADHVNNGTTRAKIMQGNWDYVVLQDRGRKVAATPQYFADNVYPHAFELNALIKEYNPCAVTLFYMTWGEVNGDPSNCGNWPPVCTYEGMDDLLRERYLILAEDNEAATAPVGTVWRNLRSTNPDIDLYDPDGSHPSLAGSYAGAIAFYTSIFKKDPNLITFNPGLPASHVIDIKNAARSVIFNDLSTWFIGEFNPEADFEYTYNGNLEYTFNNTSSFSSDFLWLFGDGEVSLEESPTHVYASEGAYEVTLKANYTCTNVSEKTELISVVLEVPIIDDQVEVTIYPNPANDRLFVSLGNFVETNSTVKILSLTGTKIFETEVEHHTKDIEIDVRSLSKGYYFLQVSSSKGNRQILKLLKE